MTWTWPQSDEQHSRYTMRRLSGMTTIYTQDANWISNYGFSLKDVKHDATTIEAFGLSGAHKCTGETPGQHEERKRERTRWSRHLLAWSSISLSQFILPYRNGCYFAVFVSGVIMNVLPFKIIFVASILVQHKRICL